jgi:hypothetical protein
MESYLRRPKTQVAILVYQKWNLLQGKNKRNKEENKNKSAIQDSNL